MKIIKLILFILLPALASCSNDDEPNGGWVGDVIPAKVTIEVEDTDGNNLYSVAYQGILDRENLSTTVSYTYDGETLPLYELKRPDEAKAPQSRYYMPHFYGVYVDHYALEYPRIRFGEFDGVEDQHEKVTVNWPDGTHSTIEFTSKALDPLSSMKIRLDDGQWVNTTKVTIVK